MLKTRINKHYIHLNVLNFKNFNYHIETMEQLLYMKTRFVFQLWVLHWQTLGQLGRVVHIDDDGDVSVKFGDGQYLFSPVCLDVVDPNSLSDMARVPSIPNNLHSLRRKNDRWKENMFVVIKYICILGCCHKKYTRYNYTQTKASGFFLVNNILQELSLRVIVL